MRLSGRERALFAITAALVAVFAAYAFVYLPMHDKWTKMGIQISEKQRKIAAIDKELKSGEKTGREYAAAVTRIKAGTGRAVTPQSLFTEVQRDAVDAGVTVRGVTPMPRKKHDLYDEVSVTVDLESELAPLVRLLCVVSGGNRGLDVRTLSVSPVEPSNPRLRAQIEISAIAYNKGAAVK